MNLQKLYKRYTDPNLVLVYQYGKVGSTTLADSIPGAINVHDLFANPLCPCSFRQRLPLAYRKIGYPVDRFCRRLIIGRRPSTDLIVPLRAPWERNVSMFFQDLPFWYVDYFVNSNAIQKVEGIGLLQHAFTERFDHEGTDRWFEKEFCRLTGIDFADIEFDKAVGYAVLTKNKYRCLLLTTKHMRSDGGKETIENFLGRSFDLHDSNRGDKKWYGPVYRNFLADTGFIESYKKRVSQSAVHQKFFS